MNIKENRSSSDRSESWRKFLLLELKVLIQLKLEAMVSWKKCRLRSFESALSTTRDNLNKKLKRRDRTTWPRKTRKHRSCSKLPPKFRRLVRRGKLRTISADSRRKSSRRLWRQRRRPSGNRDSLRPMKRSIKRRRTNKRKMRDLQRNSRR